MIEIRDLKKTYGNFSLDISMSVPKGKVSGIVGRNGSGKTTTIKAILGLIRPDSGTVTTLGQDSLKLTAKNKSMIGVAMSDSGLSSYLSAGEICSILKNMYDTFDEKRYLELCTKGELPLDKQLKEFSTGMKAKLKTIIACTHQAKLLIMDEPTTGLDVIARNEVLGLLREYLAEDDERSMLISSHISSDLENICDDIYMIHNGKIVFHNDTDKVLDEYAVLKMPESIYEKIDKKYIIRTIKEPYGYSCFTGEKKYYTENYPDVIAENCNIDDMIIMMSGEGEQK